MVIKYSFVSLNLYIVQLPASNPEMTIDIPPRKSRVANILSSN